MNPPLHHLTSNPIHLSEKSPRSLTPPSVFFRISYQSSTSQLHIHEIEISHHVCRTKSIDGRRPEQSVLGQRERCKNPNRAVDAGTRGRSFNWKRRDRICLFEDWDIGKETIADEVLS